MEVERKFLIDRLPDDLNRFPSKQLTQGYLCTSPVVRVRREGEEYFLTYKSGGLLIREEYNLPLTEESYYHLMSKTDGTVISKTRRYIPLRNGLTAELDIFDEPFAPLALVEVEFDSVEDAEAFSAPDWFGKEVTNDPAYHNSTLSQLQPKKPQ